MYSHNNNNNQTVYLQHLFGRLLSEHIANILFSFSKVLLENMHYVYLAWSCVNVAYSEETALISTFLHKFASCQWKYAFGGLGGNLAFLP